MSNQRSPAYRHRLSDKQFSILIALLNYRFATSALLNRLLSLTDRRSMNRRLIRLLDQGYIGRHFDQSLSLQHSEATYFLEELGIAALKAAEGIKLSEKAIRAIRRQKTSTEALREHWLRVLDLACQLKEEHGNNIRIFTWSELVNFSYMPSPATDLYVRLGNGVGERQYLVELIDSKKLYRANLSRVKSLISYVEDGEWETATGADCPKLILVSEAKGFGNRLKTFIDEDLGADEDAFEVCTPSSFDIS